MSQILVYMTVETTEEAEKIASHLVEKRLAACANMIEGMKSIYWWQDKIEKSNEVVLIVKTKASLFEELTEEVKKLHSYSCPCIVSVPITDGNNDFLSWIDKETK